MLNEATKMTSTFELVYTFVTFYFTYMIIKWSTGELNLKVVVDIFISNESYVYNPPTLCSML